MREPSPLPVSAAEVLAGLTPRRFQTFRAALRLGRPFTASELAQELDLVAGGSLHRDLAALESLGFLTGDPAPGVRQQGQRVMYSAHRGHARAAFETLVRLCEPDEIDHPT